MGAGAAMRSREKMVEEREFCSPANQSYVSRPIEVGHLPPLVDGGHNISINIIADMAMCAPEKLFDVTKINGASIKHVARRLKLKDC